jgi:GDPmannose 4,6-dehydratase
MRLFLWSDGIKNSSYHWYHRAGRLLLAEPLLDKDYAVHGIVRRTSNLRRSRIDHLRSNEDFFGKRFFLHYGDLADGTTLRRIFAAAKPDEFYHLAAVSLAP